MAGEVGQLLRRYINDANLWFKNGGILTNEMLGRMQAAQAPPAAVSPFTGILTAGTAHIRPEIVPWPYAVDNIGTAFDQANLWGVRFNAYNPEQNALVAVPRILTPGYTSPIARGGWQCSQSGLASIPDYRSTDSGATWVGTGGVSTPRSNFTLRGPPGIDNLFKDWGPMNWANASFSGNMPTYNDAYYHVDPGGFGPNYKLALQTSSHIGFRGAQLTISDYDTPGFGYPTVFIGWAAAGASFTWPALPTVLASKTFAWADAVPDIADPHHGTATYNIPLTPPNALGTKISYWAWMVNNEWSPTEHGSSLSLSPRTDVPFPFDTVGINDGVSSDWHAPGGYVP